MDNTHLDPAGPAPQAPADPLHDVRSLGEYRILRRLGEGGMGAVYLGYHEGQSHQVAIKVLNDQLASNQGYVDRFYREAKSGALLNHPNIVRTLNVGQDRATLKHYLVLEFVDGPSAHALLDRFGPLPVGDVVHVGLDVARALEHAHSRNVVHRDIKPDNILITRSGVSKLVDLGLARRTDEASHLTAARQGFGTTHYMPYEQATNAKHADGRSDIYALGATLYHLVTGHVPFPGENHLEVVEKKDFGEFAPASALNPAVPPALDAILGRMLARQPRDRYQTASELIIDLERSRLAAALPSFADPDQARQDPWVQACLASSAEPTRLDPELPPGPAVTLAGADDVWQLRFRNRTGRTVKAELTTRQILQRLRAGRMPAKVAARRADKDGYQPLAVYPEFRSVRPARKARPVPARAPVVTATTSTPVPAPETNGEAEPEATAAPSRWPSLLAALLIVAALAAGGLLLFLWFLLRS
ncbi:MAG TPA: serine/threonine-protein kinase [Gemmataceae bacterium]|jgi:serine/threonine-protein kinase|nr:serine/threonine-protein kinase [Gemmataceae bacterium]